MNLRLPAVLLLCAAFACADAVAQRGPGGGGGGGGRGPGGGGGMGPGGMPGMSGGIDSTGPGIVSRPGSMGSVGLGGFSGNSRPTLSRNQSSATSHAFVQVGPPGRWWDDKGFSRAVGIQDAQRKRMDTIFNDNKEALTTSLSLLQHEEKALDKLVHAKEPDETKLSDQIDRVANARAQLEKSTTRMLLALRRELTEDQWNKLQATTRKWAEAAQQQQIQTTEDQ